MTTERSLLYYYPDNASTFPHMLLRELGVPFELRLVDRKQDAQRSAEYLRLNPQGLSSASAVNCLAMDSLLGHYRSAIPASRRPSNRLDVGQGRRGHGILHDGAPALHYPPGHSTSVAGICVSRARQASRSPIKTSSRKLS